jgi:hypothetical protein
VDRNPPKGDRHGGKIVVDLGLFKVNQMPQFNYEEHQYDISTNHHSGMSVHRPILNAVLQSGENYSEVINCLVDSGADWCMFGLDKLDALGIDKSNLNIDFSLSFAAGHPIYFTTIQLHVYDVGSWEVDAGFCEVFNHQPVAILGQIGFFDRFKVMFDHRNRIFIVDP